ncbi:MAG: GtrA family protein [Patescibacteria group bacterium]
MPHLNRLYFQFRNFLAMRFPKAYCLCDSRKGAVKFFIAGSSASITDLVLLFIFHGVLKWPLVFSTSLAFIVSFVVSFTLQKFWTFRNFSQEKAAHQFVLYILNAFIGLNLNGVFMHLLVNRFGIWYLLAQVAVNLAIGFYNYIIYKSIIFKLGKNEIKHEQKIVGTSAGDVA